MAHQKTKYVYVGIDSHKDTHCAVVINYVSEKLGEITFPNVPSEFDNFLKELKKLQPKGKKLAFGIEDISAYGRALTVFLKEKKYVVKHVNASLVAAERGGKKKDKSDPIDARSAARILLADFNELPDVDPKDKYWVLGTLVAQRKAIVKMNTALKNQLHSLVCSHYPSYRQFFRHQDCASSMIFFAKYPSPAPLQGVTVDDLTQVLIHSNKRTRVEKARLILECVEKDGYKTVEFQETRDSAIQSIIRHYNNNCEEIKEIEAIISKFMVNFDYPLTSMTGIDTVTAASFIAEIGDISRFSSPSKLARYCGIAPILVSSGDKTQHHASRSGNRQLNKSSWRSLDTVHITPFFFNRKFMVANSVGDGIVPLIVLPQQRKGHCEAIIIPRRNVDRDGKFERINSAYMIVWGTYRYKQLPVGLTARIVRVNSNTKYDIQL